MKALHIREVDGFKIVEGIGEPVCDPIESKKSAYKKLGVGATHHEIITEMVSNPEFFSHVKGQVNVTDYEAKKVAITLQKKRPYEAVTRSGEIICDNRGRTWFNYVDGAWTQGEIKCVGEALPDGATWREDLSINQLRVINETEELEKIARLSPESRIEAAQVEIEAAKRAAVIKRLETEITDDDEEGLDNVRHWYRSEISRIEKKYGLPSERKKSESSG